MRAFFELKPNKILSFNYTTYPSYAFGISKDPTISPFFVTSSYYYLFENAPIVQSRTAFDVNGNIITGSGDPSGSVFIAHSHGATPTTFDVDLYFSAAFRMKNIYASSSFHKPHNYSSSSLTYSNWAVMNIPSILYGAEIKPGSFYVSQTIGAVYDDGYGGIYLTGASSTPALLVGSIMYQHGILLFGDPGVAIKVDQYMSGATIGFSGTNKTPQNIYLLDLPKGEANFSTNKSYTNYDTGSQSQRLAILEPKTYPTMVGLYNEDYELLGVIKLSTPLYHDEKTPSQIRAKLNF